MESYKYILINSFDRPNKAESDSDFQVNVVGNFDDLNQLALSHCIITNSIYNVDSSNNTFNFQENAGPAVSASIAICNYSLTEILPVIKTAMEAVSPNTRTYTLTTSNITNKITISVSAGTFSVLETGGLNLMMGFSRSTPTAQNASNVAPRVYNFTRYSNLILSTSICSGDTFNTITGASQGILESIPIGESSSGDIYVYRPTELHWKDLSGPRIDQVRIKLSDDFNKIVDLQGGYLSLYLVCR